MSFSSNQLDTFYARLFRILDTSGKGLLGGQQVFTFFLSSGLNKQALGVIWDITTEKKSSSIGAARFSIAMNLIALAQQGIAPTMANLQNEKAHLLPRMKYPPQLPLPTGSTPGGPGTNVQLQNPGTPNIQHQSSASNLSQINANFGDLLNGTKLSPTLNSSSNVTPIQTNMNYISLSPPKESTPKNMLSSNLTSIPDMNAVNAAMNGIKGNFNEYAPTKHQMRTSSMTHVLHHENENTNSEVPSYLRRVSHKMQYQEERMKEQVRIAEQREKQARKHSNDARIQNEKLLRHNEVLQDQINEARKAQSEALNQSAQALNSLGPLRVENGRLKEAVVQWKDLIGSKDDEIEELELQVNDLRLENERYESLSRDDKQTRDEMQYKIDRFSITEKELQFKIRELTDKELEYRQQKLDLEDDKRNMEFNIIQLKDTIKKLKKQVSKMENEKFASIKENEFEVNFFPQQQNQRRRTSSKLSSRTTTPVVQSNTNELSVVYSNIITADTTVVPKTDKIMDDFNSFDTSPVVTQASIVDKSPLPKQMTTLAALESGIPEGHADFKFDDILIANTTTTSNVPSDTKKAEDLIITKTDFKAEDTSVITSDNDSEYEEIEERVMSVVNEKIEEEYTEEIEQMFDDEYKNDPWYLSKKEKEAFHKFFISADTNKDGVIDGNEANKFFSKSQLDRKLLAKIWTICSHGKNAKLQPDSFYAMLHIVRRIKKSNNKLKVPDVLPECLTVDVLGKLGTTYMKSVTRTRIINKPKQEYTMVKKRVKKGNTLTVDDAVVGDTNTTDTTTVSASSVVSGQTSFGDDTGWGNFDSNTNWDANDNNADVNGNNVDVDVGPLTTDISAMSVSVSGGEEDDNDIINDGTVTAGGDDWSNFGTFGF